MPSPGAWLEWSLLGGWGGWGGSKWLILYPKPSSQSAVRFFSYTFHRSWDAPSLNLCCCRICQGFYHTARKQEDKRRTDTQHYLSTDPTWLNPHTSLQTDTSVHSIYFILSMSLWPFDYIYECLLLGTTVSFWKREGFFICIFFIIIGSSIWVLSA